MSKTGLTEKAIRSQHSSFLKECPSGEMKKEMFLGLTEVIYPNPEKGCLEFHNSVGVVSGACTFFSDICANFLNS